MNAASKAYNYAANRFCTSHKCRCCIGWACFIGFLVIGLTGCQIGNAKPQPASLNDICKKVDGMIECEFNYKVKFEGDGSE